MYIQSRKYTFVENTNQKGNRHAAFVFFYALRRRKMENNIRRISISKTDKFLNGFVKLALLARNSKKLFSNEQTAKEYLEKMENDSFSLSVRSNRKTVAFQKKLGQTEYAVIKPKGTEAPKTTIFYIHGGAYVRHLTKLHVKLAQKLSVKTGSAVILPAYLTAPKHCARESLGELSKIYESVSKESERITLSGDSCGAAICVNLLNCIEERKLKKPECLFLFSPLLNLSFSESEETKKLSLSDPMFGGTEGLSAFVDCWRGDFEKNDPRFEPFSVPTELLPKTFLFTSGRDMLSVGTIEFFEKAASGGAEIRAFVFEEMFHDFVLYPLPCAKKCVEKASELMSESNIDAAFCQK